MTRFDIVNNIAQMEETTFSDSWSKGSIEDTLNQYYNIIYAYFKQEEHFTIYRIQKEQDVLIYTTRDNKDWGISILSWDEFVDGESISADNESFLGYIIVNVIGEESELLRVAVDDKLRGQGLGQRLVEFYIRDVSDEVARYFLEVREGNAPAKGLYEKLGYEELTVRKAYYSHPTEDAVIYEYNA